jgi:hypothetical protein
MMLIVPLNLLLVKSFQSEESGKVLNLGYSAFAVPRLRALYVYNPFCLGKCLIINVKGTVIGMSEYPDCQFCPSTPTSHG